MVGLLHDWRDFSLSITKRQALCSPPRQYAVMQTMDVPQHLHSNIFHHGGCFYLAMVALQTRARIYHGPALFRLCRISEHQRGSTRHHRKWDEYSLQLPVRRPLTSYVNIIGCPLLSVVVLTMTWCELVMEPLLFHFHRLAISRDHKIVVIVSLFVRALSGRAILDSVESGGTRCRYATAISYCPLVALRPAKKILGGQESR